MCLVFIRSSQRDVILCNLWLVIPADTSANLSTKKDVFYAASGACQIGIDTAHPQPLQPSTWNPALN